MYTFDNPRLTCLLAIEANVRYSLTEFIKAALVDIAAIEDLFVNATAADEPARLSTPRPIGYVIFQTDTALPYLLIEGDGTSASDWLELAPENTPAYTQFINNLSWKLKSGSTITNGAGDLRLLNNFREGLTPSVNAFNTYGYVIGVESSIEVSGHASNIYMYSSTRTELSLNLLFDVG